MGIKKYSIALVFLGTFGLSACVPHLTQQQCQSMNWYQLGYEDGNQGKLQRDLSRDIKDCARFQLTVNTLQYRNGWAAGVRQFCRPQTAYQLGTNGSSYNNICPADLAGAFNRAYKRGLRKFCVPNTGYNIGRAGQPMPGFCAPDQVNAFRNAYLAGLRVHNTIGDIKGQINNLNGQIGDLNNRIQNRRHDIERINRKLVRNTNPQGKPYTPAERELLLINIQQDRRDIRRFRNQISDIQEQINHLQLRLNRVESS
ncbi:DUF2799 domain-containing protein [Candidiatus Paracoxiella cheracis]|uniref:DUF2799 domain-containing protein n=1 Tax=Candidiatus Paracoxiella cheracis TaxID=3405120 RepID=UPI003BF5AC5A